MKVGKTLRNVASSTNNMVAVLTNKQNNA